jgi:hypothetical protein
MVVVAERIPVDYVVRTVVHVRRYNIVEILLEVVLKHQKSIKSS